WHMALPWDGQGPIETKQRDDYYAAQVYPKVMQPPQVIVENADEEVKILASWNVKASAMAKAEKWPHYMFHPRKAAQLVLSLAQLQGMGDGWHDTPEAAIKAVSETPERLVDALGIVNFGESDNT